MIKRLALGAVALSCCAIAESSATLAQVAASDLLVRIDQLENQVRQLTGQVEQMQFRNQQLEAALRRIQDDAEYRSPEPGARGGPRAPTVAARPQSPPPPVIQQGAPAVALPPPGRRSDAFDPAENPNAPGAPRTLGSIYGSSVPPRRDGSAPAIIGEEPPDRIAGAPLDLSTIATAPDPNLGRSAPAGPIPPRNPGSTGPYVVATAPPSQSPRDTFDLGNGYLQRRDYALAEDTFREFLRKFPSDRLAGDAQFGLGESLFQRQSYRDAADAFLAMSKKFENSAKAPDALLRLGQSLAALSEKELACATFGEVARKYPRASPNVKQTVEREQKRVHC
jgi:tol-pal system protein YbgF